MGGHRRTRRLVRAVLVTALSLVGSVGSAGAAIFLNGDYIQLPIDNTSQPGRFMAEGNASGGKFNPAGTGGATGVDYWQPGTPVYNYTIAVGGSTFRINGAGWAFTPTVTDTSSGSVNSATITGSPVTGLTFTRLVSFDDTDQVITIVDTLTNTGGSTLTNVAMMDNTDPDQTDFYTSNDVVGGAAFAESPISGFTLAFASTSPSAVPDASGFSNTDPYTIISAPSDPNDALGDIGLDLAFNYGDFAPGQSKGATWYIVFGASLAAAESNACAAAGGSDSDGDLVCDVLDNCPAVSNPTQTDSDVDGFGDACDSCVGYGASDGDGDTVCDLADNCPAVSNPSQADTDGNGIGDDCNSAEDADGDEWADGIDNCPAVPNPTQADSDFDGFGDACDPCVGAGNTDGDVDTICDLADNCPALANPAQSDCDQDGVGDACDPDAVDTDGDGVEDECDNCPADTNPAQEDLNGNGTGDICESQGKLDSAGCYSASDTIAPPDGSEPTYAFIDISATGTPTTQTGHSVTGAIPIGFSFNFYGVSYTNLYISDQGFLTFLPGQIEGCCGGAPIPTAGNPDGLIAGLWSHLHMAAGSIRYQTIGSSPDRQLIVQFQAVTNFNTGTTDTWQIILNEGSNEILVQYANAHGVFGGGAGGIENQNGTIGLQWAGPQSSDLVNQAVRYVPTTALTTDQDSDSSPNCLDNCPTISNPGQEDSDSDGVGDACDNCPADSNPGQENLDGDSLGDRCDPDVDGDGDANDSDNCPLVANPGQEDGDGDGVGDVCDNCPAVSNGVSVGGDLSDTFSRLSAASADIAALVPTRFDFSEGETGFSIGDGGFDMYDGGNVLNSDLASPIAYTNGVVTASDSEFGPGSQYFTAKFTGLFALAVRGMSINTFSITGNNGADGSGNVDGAVLSTSVAGLPFTLYVKRVFNAGDPSVNHIVIVPGNGAGVSHTFSPSTDDDMHQITGLGSVTDLFYLLVSRQVGAHLDDADVIAIVDRFLEAMLAQADGDGDGLGDPCDPCENDGDLVAPEQCDDGNDVDGDCCSSECQFEPSGNPCTSDGQGCTADECDGAGTCTHDLLGSSTTCRVSNGVCDPAEQCDGSNPNCPSDAKSTAVCRPVAGGCDVAESCDGVNDGCPADGFAAAATPCRADAGACDVADSCSGSSAACLDAKEPNGTACSDGSVCTQTDSCQGGTCTGSNPLDCNDDNGCTDDSCDPLDGCQNDAEPINTCLTADKSVLILKQKNSGAKDKLLWKWIKGDSVNQTQLGDPTDTADYSLCVYAGATNDLIAAADVPPSTTAWDTISSKGYKYKDGDAQEDGVTNVIVKGSTSNKSKALLKGKGPNLPDPTLGSLPFPVTAQLVNRETGVCMEGVFNTAIKNDAAQFKAKAQQ